MLITHYLRIYFVRVKCVRKYTLNLRLHAFQRTKRYGKLDEHQVCEMNYWGKTGHAYNIIYKNNNRHIISMYWVRFRQSSAVCQRVITIITSWLCCSGPNLLKMIIPTSLLYIVVNESQPLHHCTYVPIGTV